MIHIKLTKFNKLEIFRVGFFYEVGVISCRYQPTRRSFDKQSGDLRGVYFKDIGLIHTQDLYIFSNTIQDGMVKWLFNELLDPSLNRSRYAFLPASFNALFAYYQAMSDLHLMPCLHIMKP